jgi:eukaryotic-like serine/threonine-protein kinase
MSKSTDPSRDLLFGLLALQNGLIDQGALFSAFAAWTRDKARSLADYLVDLGFLDAPRRAAVEAIAGLHVQALGGDATHSLAVLALGRSTRESLARAGGPDIELTLGHVGSGRGSTQEDIDPELTGTSSVGTATSDGQRFRILRPHARGGLGVVFVALDGELHREVALKQILEKHADDPVSRQRFVAEAEITGGLEHPGVVPVYGLGADANGRPYYAMRLIKGDSLKDAIAQFHDDDAHEIDTGRRSLELRKLLRRFTDVCNAVDYAHSRGVIHRDLKPANIIVGKHGETLVVDWGLAKVIGRSDASAGEQTIAPSSSGSSETLPGSALGTPAYMSPEQARGELQRLGPRSDVYSLGTTLYCLLTGKPAFEGDDVGVILRAVQEGQFPRPSQHDLSLDKALEAICLKSMATQPDHRYATPRALADDLDRWMADLPVMAWREPLSRRARRWARQNRTPMTAAAVALVAGVIGPTAVLAVQTQAKADLAASLTRETNANTRLARANAELTSSRAAVQARYDLAVEAIKMFHTGVTEDFLLKQEQFKHVRDGLLKSASDFYGKLGALLGNEADLTSRRALWRANYELAELTGKIGALQDALAAHRQVLAARLALAAETPADSKVQTDVGRSLAAVAFLLASTGRTTEAEEMYRKAEKLLVELASSVADAGAPRVVLANCRSNLGTLLYAMGRNDESLSVYRLARANQEAPATASGMTTESHSDLANTILRIAVLLATTGKASEAEHAYREALALFQKLVDDHPMLAGFRNSLAASHNNLGNLLSGRGKLSEAEDEYRKALAIHQTLVDDNPAVTDFRSSLANDRQNLGFLLMNIGKALESKDELRKAMEIRRKLADDHPAVPQIQRHLADSLVNIGWQLAQAGKTGEAIDHYTQEEAIRRKLADSTSGTPADRDALANCQTNTADVLRRSGRFDDALAACERALAVREPLVAAHPEVPRYRARLGETYLRLGQVRYDRKDPAGAAVAWKRAGANYDAIKFRADSQSFLLACWHAGLAGLAGRPDSGVSTTEGAAHAEEAMAVLHQAVTTGYRNPDAFRTESALDSLRNRLDFRVLLMDLAFPTNPFAR